MKCNIKEVSRFCSPAVKYFMISYIPFGWELQVPWRPHHQQTDMVQAHQDSCGEGTTKPIPLQETQILKRFYSCTIEIILTGCITAWYGSCSASDRKALQWIVRTAQYITGAKLPARQCQRKALKIVKDFSHTRHRLISLPPHGKRYRSAKFRSKRLLNSFYPLNS